MNTEAALAAAYSIDPIHERMLLVALLGDGSAQASSIASASSRMASGASLFRTNFTSAVAFSAPPRR